MNPILKLSCRWIIGLNWQWRLEALLSSKPSVQASPKWLGLGCDIYSCNIVVWHKVQYSLVYLRDNTNNVLFSSLFVRALCLQNWLPDILCEECSSFIVFSTLLLLKTYRNDIIIIIRLMFMVHIILHDPRSLFSQLLITIHTEEYAVL